MKIKIGIRHNLMYPILLTTFTLFRSINSVIMSKKAIFRGSLLLTIIMFFSEFISGLILYITQNFRNSKGKKLTFKEINIKRNTLNKEKSSNRNSYRTYMLLLAISFLDFIEYVIATYYLPSYTSIYKSNLNIIQI